MKNNIFKIVIGLASFIIAAVLVQTIISPLWTSFLQDEILLDVLFIGSNILVAVILYRLAKFYLLEKHPKN